MGEEECYDIHYTGNNDVKQYVAEVLALKIWEADQSRKQEKAESKRNRLVAAKLAE